MASYVFGPATEKYKFNGNAEDVPGLYDYNARTYTPSWGAMLQADVVVPSYSIAQSPNRYAYVLNGPTRYRDPSGHFPMTNGELIGVPTLLDPSTVNQNEDWWSTGRSPVDEYGRISAEAYGLGFGGAIGGASSQLPDSSRQLELEPENIASDLKGGIEGISEKFGAAARAVLVGTYGHYVFIAIGAEGGLGAGGRVARAVYVGFNADGGFTLAFTNQVASGAATGFAPGVELGWSTGPENPGLLPEAGQSLLVAAGPFGATHDGIEATSASYNLPIPLGGFVTGMMWQTEYPVGGFNIFSGPSPSLPGSGGVQ